VLLPLLLLLLLLLQWQQPVAWMCQMLWQLHQMLQGVQSLKTQMQGMGQAVRWTAKAAA
jgi:hypothetical protein